MTKHDTWVRLKPGSLYEPVLDLFPNGMIPMRDPFPLERVIVNNKQIALWIIDFERLEPNQANALAQLIASRRGADVTEVMEEAVFQGGFAMINGWVESMECDAEGFQRSKEFADFFETAPQPPSARAWREFYNSQHDRWIEGDEQPPPINSIDDIDPRLRTPELEERWKMRQIEQAIAVGGYSVFDVLSGRATVDVLNQIDPKNSYSLVGDDDDFEDDE
ncbi:hypothetical protein [Halotia branconii]|uniref:Uncharacterized protein n=1 Tax=Halotia branconii CENA392 TaxID=1539056 RepID=A0AAJ6NSW3_9CYAN|nr:hypothetical protein [Halotia branconii]WGV25943.1 hypothetical protein QI031_30275 [Halotia branconii CENA392]WGV25959.1 hypothetical protein QI031_00085 [Halotia branconii CENA392]